MMLRFIIQPLSHVQFRFITVAKLHVPRNNIFFFVKTIIKLS